MPKNVYRIDKNGDETMFSVKKRTLLLIAGIVWFIAGFNVARLGFLSYLIVHILVGDFKKINITLVFIGAICLLHLLV